MAGGSGDEEEYSSCTSSCGCSDLYVASVVKTDSSGNLEWIQAYPCGEWGCDNAAEYIDVTSDGGYMAFLDTCAFGEDMFGFLKLGEPAPPCENPTYVAVDALACGLASGPRGSKYGQVTVTVKDECGDPAVGYDVTGIFTGSYDETIIETTNGSGVAVLTTTTAIKKPSYQFCVDDVVGTISYDDTQNVITCCGN